MGTRPWPRPVVRLARSAFSLSFLLFAWNASTAAGNPVDNPDTRPQSYSIEGRLVSGPQRQPMAQVTLTLVGVRGPLGSQITDRDGRFQFHGLREGNYALEIALADGRRVTMGIDVFDGPIQDLQINVDELAPRPSAPADPVLRVWALRVPAKAEKQYREGLAALAKDDLGRAIRYLKKAVDLYPEFAAAHAALGSAFLLRPDDWRIYYTLGENYFRAGQSEKAEQSLRRAHQLHTEAPRLHVLLINALVTQEKWADSLQEMEEFLRLFPDDRLAPNVRLKRDALRDHLRTYSTSAR